jgi:hypothetical protein
VGAPPQRQRLNGVERFERARFLLAGLEVPGFRLKLSESWGFCLKGWELQADLANASPGRPQLSKPVLSLPVRSKRDR